ncbi:MAG: GGDEF domain-containing protein [Candidatus Rokubacteria bacterium]|nr:GGDEF domain-containing protein [Candidatus Rokubacteria bacterium]
MKTRALRLVPGGLLVLAATALVHAAPLGDAASALVPAYPYAVFGAGLLLGLRFSRSRVILALLVLALADRALHSWSAGGDATAGSGRAVFAAVALLLPVDLAAIGWMRERGVLGAPGRWGLVVILLQMFAVASIRRPELAAVGGALELALVNAGLTEWTAIPQVALLAFAVALVAATLRFLLGGGAIESGLLWTLGAAFLALTARRIGVPSSLYLATGGLILVVSLIEASHAMAYVDELTGLPARRALGEALDAVSGRYAVGMIDIDHFKKFNDQYGHDAGDQMLRMVASRLAQVTGGGRAFRYGGEEFAVVFPGKSVDEVRPHLEALRRAIQVSAFMLRSPDRPRRKPKPAADGRLAGKRVFVTISVGVAEGERRRSRPQEVLRAADEALYRAKEAGRNRLST